MWLNQNEIQTLWNHQLNIDNKIEFRLFAPNNTTITTETIKVEQSLSIQNYQRLIVLSLISNYKKQEKKENNNITISLNQHSGELEKDLRKKATELDPITNKLVFDPSKISYLAMSNDFFRNQKWRKILGKDDFLLKKVISPIDNLVIDEVWSILTAIRGKGSFFENLKLNFYNPKKQVYVSESETKKITKNSKIHYLKYKVDKNDNTKITNIVLDQINDSLAKHILYQHDLINRIKILTENSNKKSSIKNILGLTKKEYQEFDNTNKAKDETKQKDLEYLQGHLLVVEQNINTLKKIKQILLYQYELSFLVGYDNLWHSIFTIAISLIEEETYSIFYLTKTKELIIVPEKEAIATIGILLDEEIINAPNLVTKMSSFSDASEFFDYLDIGIIKIASIMGKELEGVKIDLIGDICVESIDYKERTNFGKITIIKDDNKDGNIKLIEPLHQYNIKTFNHFSELKLPLINKFSNEGKLSNLGSKFQVLENYIVSYIENYLVEIYERHEEYFGAKQSKEVERVFSSDDSVTELYPLPEKNWFVNLRDPVPLASRSNWAIPLPLFLNQQKSIWVDSFEDLAKKAINPIYRVVLTKNLKYELYEANKAVLVSDTNSKIPLGLSMIQYRSKILTDLRREKRLEWSVFCIYADKLYAEILELFNKYEVIQIQFTPEESIKWQNWFFGKEEDYKTQSSSIIYFYKKISFEKEEVKIDNNYNYLSLEKNTLKDIYVNDGVNGVYTFGNASLDFNLEKRILDVITINKATSESNTVYYYTNNSEQYTKTLADYDFIFDKKININLLLDDNSSMGNNQVKDIEPILNKYESDIVKIALMLGLELNTENLDSIVRQEELLAENIVKFFYHRGTSMENSKEPIILWLNLYTINLKEEIDKSMERVDLKEVYSSIYKYIEYLNEMIFPILKFIPNNEKSMTQKDLVSILNNFVYLIKPFLPYYAEKIFQIIYFDKNTNSQEYNLNLINLKNPSSDIKNKVKELIELKASLNVIRELNKIPVYQGLYADFSYLKEDTYFIRYIQVYLNLIPKSLMNIEGQIEKIQFQKTPIIIDMVLDTSLTVLAAQKELSKILLAWKTKNQLKTKQSAKVQISFSDFDDIKVLNKLRLNSYWPELLVETIWDEYPIIDIDKIDNYEYKLLDITNIYLKTLN